MLELNKIYNKDCNNGFKLIDNNTIDMVYADILFGTNKKFKDYIDIDSSFETIKNFYNEKFLEIKRILKDSGSIFIHCDYRINYKIRFLLDSIFGEKNFCNEIIWLYGIGGKGRKKAFPDRHQTIYFYCKDKKEQKFIEIYDENIIGKNGKKKIFKSYWKIPNIADKSGYLQRDNEYKLYDTQKPIKLLERIILCSTNKNDIVLDPFCGSGTTCLAAKNLNRNFIGFDINNKAVDITNKRLLGLYKKENFQ